MAKPKNINKDKPLYKSMDYEALFKEGIEFIQKYSGDIWTDYNVHDPGVTMLEYLCFSLTDMGYRCNFPIQDLLYSRENRRIAKVDNAFYPLEAILPCAALVVDDYRKLIIDQIPSVDNVWFEPVLEQKEKFKGLYDVQLQINQERQRDSTPDQIKADVAKLLAANRNLCEDIREIHVLSLQYLEVKAIIHLENDASSEQVLANVVHELTHFLAPRLPFHDLDEMFAAGYDINDLFDGPPIERGFIKTDYLRPINTEINISQLRDTISDTPGVRSLEQVKVKLNGFTQHREVISIPKNTYFVLSDSMRIGPDTKDHPITFSRNNQSFKPNYFLSWQIINAQLAQETQFFRGALEMGNRPTVSEKDLADIGAYYSVQRFFPAVYGIHAYGMPRDSSLIRRAQARQLKGYLAIFETLFSSYLRQLTQIRYLFSIEEKSPVQDDGTNFPSHFARFPFDIPDIKSLIALDGDFRQEDVDNILEQYTALQDQSLDSRNEFLDHLLARFGEVVSSDWQTQFVKNPNDLSLIKQNQIKIKCRILQEYITLSRNRGKGFDYTLPTIDKNNPETWYTDTVSGLKKRLCYLINLTDSADRCLTSKIPLEYFDLIKNTESTESNTLESIRVPMKSILRNGFLMDNYEINKSENKEEYVVSFRDTVKNQLTYYPLFQLETRKEAHLKLSNFMEAVKAFDTDSKGLYIIEHLLLRPLHMGGYKLRLDISDSALACDSFESLGHAPLEDLKGIAERLLLLASNQKNYEVLSDGMRHFVIIKQNNQPVLVSTKNYDTKELAAEAYEMVRKGMQRALKEDPALVNDWIAFDPEEIKGMAIDKAFYSHSLSILLPKWPTSFMEQSFQAWFKKLVAQNIPAHHKVDIFWLDFEKMKTFEQSYWAWMSLKCQDGHDIAALDELSYNLVEKLLQLSQKTNTNELKTRSQSLSKTRLDAILDKFKPYFLLNHSELQIIEGIDSALEYRFKKEGLGTWTLLAIADLKTISNVFKKAASTENIIPESLKLQARLASTGKWTQLESLQQEMNKSKGFVAESKLQKIINGKLNSLKGN